LSRNVCRLSVGLVAIALIAMSACGRAAVRMADASAPRSVIVAASPVQRAVTEPFKSLPSVSRLVTVAGYPSMGITLDPVDPQVNPPISASDAYARCQWCPHGTPLQGFGQQLAYFSAKTPATIPAACVPSGVPMPASCANDPGVPLHQHTLEWVFTWYSTCPSFGGPPGSSPSRPFTCLNVVPFDATTGDETYSLSGGV
jgi:hypothetical protein